MSGLVWIAPGFTMDSGSEFTRPTATAAFIPTVYEKDGPRLSAMDLFSVLLKHGIVDLTGPIDAVTAKIITAQLRYLSINYPREGIQLCINSPGGEVASGFAIIDCMRTLNRPVRVIIRGMAASMAAVIAAAGKAGLRQISENSKVMIHGVRQHGGGTRTTRDLTIEADEMIDLDNRILAMLSKYCRLNGEPIDEVRRRMSKAMDKDTWYGPEAALRAGIVDEIIENQ